VSRELLRVPRLLRLARRLGIEKVVLKQGQMFLFFVDSTNQAYYQSPMFGRLLNYLQAHPARVQIRERNGRRSFALANVPTVAEGLSILDTILNLESV